MSKNLILIAGLSGTGKTTVGYKLEKELEDYILISQNEIRRKEGMKKMPKKQDHILRKMDTLAATCLLSDQGVIFESVHTFSARRHQIYGVASACKSKVITLECVCSEDTAKERMWQRPEKDDLISDPRDPAVYDKLKARWEPIEKDFEIKITDHVSYLVYDTQKNTIERRIVGYQAANFIKRVEKILLK